MKLYISLNHPQLSDAISCAQKIEGSCDGFAIGTVLLLKNGMRAVETFRKRFPNKELLCDCRISDHEQDIVKMVSVTGSDWATVIAPAHPHIIKEACMNAHALGLKIMLELLGNSGAGQYALDATELGVDALIFHLFSPNGAGETLSERWDLVRKNTKLPVFISTGISKKNIKEVLKLKPDGIIVGGAIVESEDPQTEAEYFSHTLLSSKKGS
ncbi:MAG: orotidine 5'-phosphate decarboxylase [Candidatus Dependentiae bacterium]|nr:orotidine 5'-phosphate decarboxylase [Candidatus Dependentiae bacterium]